MTDKAAGSAMPVTLRRRLDELRHPLLRLHRVLLDDERAAYERAHGRISAGELLQLLLSHPQFSWLRAISELVVQIDEMLESKEAGAAASADDLLKAARSLLLSATSESEFAKKYHDALQRLPDAVLAHRETTVILSNA